MPSEAFCPSSTLLAVQETLATALYGVPTMFIAELDLLSSKTIPTKNFSQLRTGIAAGSSIPSALMRKLNKVLGLPELTICYGMTETSPVSAMTHTDDPEWARCDTVGRLLPHVEAKIVSPAGETVPIDTRGELAVSGYLVMQGYYNDTKRTDEVLQKDEDGKLWMLTGDEASMDEQGYIKITGRIKDLIIRGGENIHPLEIENAVLSLDEVSDISVVGLPDDKYGEVVAAFVVRKTSGGTVGEVAKSQEWKREEEKAAANKIREGVRQMLSSHLVPKYVFWIDGYPKTASGKIQKFKLREMGIEMVKQGMGL